MNTYEDAKALHEAMADRFETIAPELSALVSSQEAARYRDWVEHYLFAPRGQDISKPCRDRWGWCFTHMAKALPEGYTPPRYTAVGVHYEDE